MLPEVLLSEAVAKAPGNDRVLKEEISRRPSRPGGIARHLGAVGYGESEPFMDTLCVLCCPISSRAELKPILISISKNQERNLHDSTHNYETIYMSTWKIGEERERVRTPSA